MSKPKKVKTSSSKNLVSDSISLPALRIAWDTEYQRNDSTSNKNTSLSYQIAGENLATGIFKTDIYYPDYNFDVRLTLGEVIEFSFAMFDIYDEDIDGASILFLCHFCLAEFSMLRDRKEVAYLFEYLYKTVVTFKKRKFTFTTRNGVEVTVIFEMSDTFLLLPPSHKSLEKASKLLLDEEHHKKELSQYEKSHMLELLQNNPKKFEEYAIHDAVITGLVYKKLQKILNEINGTEDKRYVTIGSATVKHYQKSSKDMFEVKGHNSQYDAKNSIYQEHLDLAKRSYFGGVNNSYFIGEAKEMVFLDIDFSSAYPTVMNMLRLGDFGEPVESPAPVEANFGDD